MERVKSQDDKKVVTVDLVNGQSVERTYSRDEWEAKQRGEPVGAPISKPVLGEGDNGGSQQEQ